jgi:hypothetical protein
VPTHFILREEVPLVMSLISKRMRSEVSSLDPRPLRLNRSGNP